MRRRCLIDPPEIDPGADPGPDAGQQARLSRYVCAVTELRGALAEIETQDGPRVACSFTQTSKRRPTRPSSWS